MRTRRYTKARPMALALSLDFAALAVWFYYIPRMNRPLDALAILAAILGVVTAWAAGPGILRNLCLVVISAAVAVFGLEMAQKRFDILGYADKDRADDTVGMTGKYAWSPRVASTYVAARDMARVDGFAPEALAERFAGDVFSGLDKGKLVTATREIGGTKQIFEGLKPMTSVKPPLGFELTPDNVTRYRVYTEDESRLVVDCVVRSNALGFRETRCAHDAEDAYIFLGCSFTFGQYLNDNQTLPHYFSSARRYKDRVVNLAMNNYGPHHALRDLELDYHLGDAGMRPGRVRAVFYGLIDDHARRAFVPDPPESPRYILADGKPVLAEPREKSPVVGRLESAVEKSRVFQGLRERLYYRTRAGDAPQKWRLTHAILAEIDRLCRERYGVGLIVVYWGEDPLVKEAIEKNGIRLVSAFDAFEPDWRNAAIKYLSFDGHPSAFANSVLARYLNEKVN